jgi:Putative sensor
MSRLLAPLFECRTYLQTADLLLDLAVGTAWFSIFTTLVTTGASLVFTLVGLPILTATFYLARIAARLERRRARVFLALDIEEPARVPATGEGVLQRLVTPFRDRTTWKELRYVWLVQPILSVVNFSVAAIAWYLPLWALTLPIYATYAPPELWTGGHLDAWQEIIPVAVGGLVLLPLVPRIIRRLSALDVATARWALSPSRPTAPGNRTEMQRPTHAPSSPSSRLTQKTIS